MSCFLPLHPSLAKSVSFLCLCLCDVLCALVPYFFSEIEIEIEIRNRNFNSGAVLFTLAVLFAATISSVVILVLIVVYVACWGHSSYLTSHSSQPTARSSQPHQSQRFRDDEQAKQFTLHPIPSRLHFLSGFIPAPVSHNLEKETA